LHPTQISCISSDWRSVVAEALEEVQEVDLVHFLFPADTTFCEALALKHSVDFTLETKKRVAFFRKRKLPGKTTNQKNVPAEPAFPHHHDDLDHLAYSGK
jgi:hypothetical protein